MIADPLRSLFPALLVSVLAAVPGRAQERPPLPSADGVEFRADAPLGMPDDVPVPADSPWTRASFELGRDLFFDPILSRDHTVSCASCHEPDLGFASPQPRPLGVGGRRADRHAPALINRAWGESQRWDGEAETLEQQVLMPLDNPSEMAVGVDEALSRLRAHASYPQRFASVYGRQDIGRDDLARALASFVRGLFDGDTVVDLFVERGDRSQMTVAERAGMWIYESKGRCWKCHVRPNYTDERFHNTGVGVGPDGMSPAGRMAVTGRAADRGAFKTPTLRGLARTAPYMHDGSLATLEDVVAFYRRGGNANPNLSPHLEPLALTDREAEFLVAFLRGLSRPAELSAAAPAGAEGTRRNRRR